MVRDRKSRTVLRTNQIVGFVTMPDWKKIKHDIFTCEDIMFLHENPPGISNFNLSSDIPQLPLATLTKRFFVQNHSLLKFVSPAHAFFFQLNQTHFLMNIFA